MYPSQQMPALQLRFPQKLKDWIAAEAKKNGASQNSEIIRSIRERMERQEKADAVSAPVESNDGALA